MIVENCKNSSYIDTLFVSMFYKPSLILNILSDKLNDLKFTYLQELLCEYFIFQTRAGNVITSEIINELRNYFVFCGWKQNDNFMNLFNVKELYDFVLSKHKKQLLINDLSNNNITELNYLNFDIKNDCCIKQLLFDWETQHELKNVPDFIALNLNRSNETTFTVNIMDGFYFKNDRKKYWGIHSIICKSDNHYYSVVLGDKNWHIFNNSKLPSLSSVDIYSEEIGSKIKKECVFLFYTLKKIT